MEQAIALQVNDLDNVATIFAEGVKDGSTVILRDKAGNARPLTVIGDIPYGHKAAVEDIPAGGSIRKYGEQIGAASQDIRQGEYVHVHNLYSMRGRGDLPEREEPV